jgi:A/G-specific adenine glycosylase
VNATRTELPIAEVRAAILGWYRRLGRTLLFRRTTDPYRVLVLETMAQQTQIARAAERWADFVDRFPTFEALAAASSADVIGAWRGLGYNRRAVNLLRAARTVVSEHGGELPRDLVALQRLPGIGPYTARGVAATAFGLPVGAVDTNVRRVLGRLTTGNVATDARHVQALADALVAPEDPAHWTHALMDLGATVCLPAKPDCGSCPVRTWCRYANDPASPGPSVAASRPHRPAPPFTTTTRWLRGRILDRLRDGDDDPGWVALGEPIGSHPIASVEAALAAMARDGLVELRSGSAGSGLEARLPRD